MSAREEAEHRWPDWKAPEVGDPEPDYSEIDAKWQNLESEFQRSAFMQGAQWQLERARYGECANCHQPFERYDSPGGVFRSHVTHPDDNHDVEVSA